MDQMYEEPDKDSLVIQENDDDDNTRIMNTESEKILRKKVGYEYNHLDENGLLRKIRN